jgi:hypothetical protein
VAERHDGPMTAFLARMFRGELPDVWLPHRFALELGRGVACERLSLESRVQPKKK